MKKSIQNIVVAAIAAIVTTICIQKCSSEVSTIQPKMFDIPSGMPLPDQIPSDTVYAIG